MEIAILILSTFNLLTLALIFFFYSSEAKFVTGLQKRILEQREEIQQLRNQVNGKRGPIEHTDRHTDDFFE